MIVWKHINQQSSSSCDGWKKSSRDDAWYRLANVHVCKQVETSMYHVLCESSFALNQRSPTNSTSENNNLQQVVNRILNSHKRAFKTSHNLNLAWSWNYRCDFVASAASAALLTVMFSATSVISVPRESSSYIFIKNIHASIQILLVGAIFWDSVNHCFNDG